MEVWTFDDDPEGVVFEFEVTKMCADEVGAKCGEELVLAVRGGSRWFGEQGHTGNDGSDADAEEDFAFFVEMEDEKAGFWDEGSGIEAGMGELRKAYGKGIVTKVEERAGHADGFAAGAVGHFWVP
ncbi:MAG TPA: hypothetical protein PK156_27285 [Polyangium sp.]|nr:hypothetical protein [Polyangium sp.]